MPLQSPLNSPHSDMEPLVSPQNALRLRDPKGSVGSESFYEMIQGPDY